MPPKAVGQLFRKVRGQVRDKTWVELDSAVLKLHIPPRMALSIQVLSDDADVPKVTFDAPRIVLGRGQSCDLRLPDASVSRRHASVRQRGSDYLLLDEGSINGTFVGETRLSPGAAHTLRGTTRVRCGLVELNLTLESAPVSPNPQQLTREIALRLIEGALSQDGLSTAPQLLARFKNGTSLEFALSEAQKSYVVGRGPQADFDLSDDDVSRRHLEVTRRGSDVVVRDLGAKNPLRLGTHKLPTDTELRWSPGTVIEISGAVSLELIDPLSDALAKIEAASEEIALPALAAQAHPQTMQSAQALDYSAPAGEPGRATTDAPLARRGQTSQRFNGTDVLVALFAVSILLLSLAGMFWLLRG